MESTIFSSFKAPLSKGYRVLKVREGVDVRVCSPILGSTCGGTGFERRNDSAAKRVNLLQQNLPQGTLWGWLGRGPSYHKVSCIDKKFEMSGRDYYEKTKGSSGRNNHPSGAEK